VRPENPIALAAAAIAAFGNGDKGARSPPAAEPSQAAIDDAVGAKSWNEVVREAPWGRRAAATAG